MVKGNLIAFRSVVSRWLCRSIFKWTAWISPEKKWHTRNLGLKTLSCCNWWKLGLIFVWYVSIAKLIDSSISQMLFVLAKGWRKVPRSVLHLWRIRSVWWVRAITQSPEWSGGSKYRIRTVSWSGKSFIRSTQQGMCEREENCCAAWLILKNPNHIEQWWSWYACQHDRVC